MTRVEAWWDYVTQISGTDVHRLLADDTGFHPTTFTRWKQGTSRPDPAQVIAFARTYDRPPVEALVAAGYLQQGDAADVVQVWRGLRDFTDEALVAEVLRRLKAGQPLRGKKC